MFIGDPPGNTDRILDFSTALTGGMFFTPTVDFLDDPPPLPGIRRRQTAPPTPRHRFRRLTGDRQPERTTLMNNLYRDLAPVTEAAWAEIEMEATRTFKRHIAGRRVVDVSEPGGPVTAAVSTGHLLDVSAPGDGVVAHLRDAKPLVRLRVPFTVSRIDDRRRRARLAGLRLGSGQGGRQEAGVRRGPGDLRGLRGGARSTASAGAAPTRRWRCPRTRARSPT